MSTKLTYNFVKEQFEKEGYTLLSEEYVDNKSKLSTKCVCGNIYDTTYNRWKNGYRCPICSRKKAADKIRQSFDDVKKVFSKEGYTLLSETYKTNHKKLKVMCPVGHEYEVSLSSFKSGRRCPKCAKIKQAERQKYSFEYIKEQFEKRGYTLISEDYTGAFDKLKYICPEGHQGEIAWFNFQQGHGCNTCAKDVRRKSCMNDFSDVVEEFNKVGYTVLSTEDEYKNNQSKITFMCDKGHISSVRYNDFNSKGVRCTFCSEVGHSKAELEIYEIIKKHFPNATSGDRTIIPPMELDIYIPEKKVAIEYCGLYWHSTKIKPDKNYHLNKLNLCNEQGVDLITIFEDEWVYKRDVVESRLMHILGIGSNNRVYARNCIVKEIPNPVASEFINNNHLQNAGTNSISIGAYYNDVLVSVMAFSKPSISKGTRKIEDGTFELNRFCSKVDYEVVGIASKLFKYFTRNYDFNTIYTFGDKRWSKGEVYVRLGFEKEYDTRPNYWYTLGQTRLHRYNFRKSELGKKLENFDESLTEEENMMNNGYIRVYDCGHVKWKYKI